MIDKNSITGVILAGGRATRMGGVDKGLQTVQGIPMALLSLLRLAPQVGEVMINANRNMGAYESMGVPVWPDSMSGFPGPLAGFVTALERCETAYLVTVPCDTPRFPDDLVERLAAALEAEDAEIAMVATRESREPHPSGESHVDAKDDDSASAAGEWRTQPVFCLMRADLLASLVAFTSAGNRKIDSWTALHRCVEVRFDDADAFVGANTIAELQRL
ncbi:molybdenum cofactor guanylyltransferase [Pigmentiphaga litoralis]|uniref:molybdenum cofactor guanylyltransferase MobA n=1 Tax=Pigmentiphaga litoralis TaxID=516702 RepID=UPI00167A4F22|nr:molybdenum cofactor guanylyltransferase MobA [Pigmentiphaga litoralis]GGX15999.1 molybdenum cofactor guanylyltransferase [Pigmentiphaga litoralis]